MTRDNMTFEEDVIDRLARIETSATLIPDHEGRLRALEKHQNFQLGFVSVLSLIGGSVASFLATHFRTF